MRFLKHLLTVSLIGSLVVVVFAQQGPPLSLAQIEKLLAGGVGQGVVSNAVNDRGIDFEATANARARLRKAGAGAALMQALEKASAAYMASRPAVPTTKTAPDSALSKLEEENKKLRDALKSTGQGMHREGFVVEFLPDTEERWVGNFQPGLTGYSTAIAHPNRRSVIVISGGEAYVIDPRAKKIEEMFGGAIEFLGFATKIEALVLGNGLWFDIIRSDGRRSTTQRISWDGMTQVEIDGSRLRGQAYDPLSDSSVPFEVNLLDASHVGGSYPREFVS